MKTLFMFALIAVAFTRAIETPTTQPPLESSDVVTKAHSGNMAVDAVTDDVADTLKGMLEEGTNIIDKVVPEIIINILSINKKAVKVPKYIKEVAFHTTLKLIRMINQAVWSLKGPIYDAMNKAAIVADVALTQSIVQLDKLHKCAVKQGITDNIQRRIISEIFHCIDDRVRKCKFIFSQLNLNITKIGSVENEISQQISNCYSKYDLKENDELETSNCLTSWSSDLATNAVVISSELSSTSQQIGLNILAAAADCAKCVNDKVDKAIKLYTDAGIDTNTCLDLK